MEHFAGLDVATKETVISVVDERGESVLEASVLSDPDAIAAALAPFARTLRRAGHEAGALSPWLQKGLLERGVPAVCLETLAVRAALKAQRNKTDVTDARGMAQMMRTGWFREVHVKSEESHRLRLLLNQRRALKRKFLDLENAVRQSLKVFGVKLSAVSRGQFEAVAREKVAHDPMLAELTDAMLNARAALWEQYKRLHKLLVQITARDPVCERFMAIPGVGPVAALSFKAAVDDPARFRRTRDVGAHFGLTPARYQSGDSVDRHGGISKRGDKEARTALYEAASGLLVRSKKWSALRVWGLEIAQRSGHKKAVVALARRLAVTMLAMWRDGTEFDWGSAPADPNPPSPRPCRMTPREPQASRATKESPAAERRPVMVQAMRESTVSCMRRPPSRARVKACDASPCPRASDGQVRRPRAFRGSRPSAEECMTDRRSDLIRRMERAL